MFRQWNTTTVIIALLKRWKGGEKMLYKQLYGVVSILKNWYVIDEMLIAG